MHASWYVTGHLHSYGLPGLEYPKLFKLALHFGGSVKAASR
jgi:hypothetical protein